MGPPHGIRHAGAAHYVANNGDLEYARRRGRWDTALALQRYAKTRVLIRRRAELQQQQLLDGEPCWASPGKATAAATRSSPAAKSPLRRAPRRGPLAAERGGRGFGRHLQPSDEGRGGPPVFWSESRDPSQGAE
eukprot:4547495-Pyramimonas_sp.AAC.1